MKSHTFLVFKVLGALACVLAACSSKGAGDATNAAGAGGDTASGGGEAGSSGEMTGTGGSTENAGAGGNAGGVGGNAGGTGGNAGGIGGNTAGAGGSKTGGVGGIGPATAWTNVTANLISQTAGGGDVSLVSAQPGSARIIVSVAGKGLWATDDSGKTWFHLGTGAGSAVIDHYTSAIVYDPEHQGTFWESGIYGTTGGIFKTTDNGVTFKRLGNITHNDMVTIDFSDPERKTLLAGSHETARKLFLSKDGGTTWNDIGMNLPADSHFSSAPQIIDTSTFLMGSCGYGNGACGVYRSTDGGTNWTRAATQGAVNRVLWTQKNTFWWNTIYDKGVITSVDGVTWTQTATGPVQAMSGSLTELPDGRVVALGRTHLQATTDGKAWKPIGERLPFAGANCGVYGFTYSVATKTFFINHNDCKGKIIPTSVYSLPFDYTTQ